MVVAHSASPRRRSSSGLPARPTYENALPGQACLYRLMRCVRALYGTCGLVVTIPSRAGRPGVHARATRHSKCNARGDADVVLVGRREALQAAVVRDRRGYLRAAALEHGARRASARRPRDRPAAALCARRAHRGGGPSARVRRPDFVSSLARQPSSQAGPQETKATHHARRNVKG